MKIKYLLIVLLTTLLQFTSLSLSAQCSTPFAINGPTNVCVGSSIFYQTSEFLTPLGSVVSGGGEILEIHPEKIKVKWITVGVQTLTLKSMSTASCPNGRTSTLTVNVLPSLDMQQDLQITGPAVLCANSAGSYTSPNLAGYTIEWNLLPIISSNNAQILTTNGNEVTLSGGTGVYNLYASYTNGSCVLQQLTTQVRISEGNSTIQISGPNGACNEAETTFYAVGDFIDSYSWNLTAGGELTVSGDRNQNAKVKWQSIGNHTLTLTANNSCSSNRTITKSLSISPPLLAPSNITKQNEIVCVNTLERFSVPPVNGATSYEWKIITNNGLTTINTLVPYVDRIFSSQTTASISVRPVNNFCIGPESPILDFNVGIPSIQITSPASICAGAVQTLSLSSTIDLSGFVFDWNVGEGGSIIGPNSGATINVLWGSEGQKFITASSLSNCGVFGTTPVMINVTPSSLILNPIIGVSNACIGSYNYSAYSNVPDLTPIWSISGGGTISTIGSTGISVNWITPGVYTLSASFASPCGGSQTQSITVTVANGSKPTILPSTPPITETLCAETLPITKSYSVPLNPGYSYTWGLSGTNGNSLTSSSNIASIEWSQLGTSYLSVRPSTAVCSGESTLISATTISQLPNVSITTDGATNLCSGQSVLLSASISGVAYQWNLNGSPILNARSSSYRAALSGNYSVTVTNNSNCSTTSASTLVAVTDLPAATISASGPTSFCNGGSITLTASPGSSYLWSNGATTQAISVLTSGNYSVIVTNGNGCSTTSVSTNVVVYDIPAANIITNNPTNFCRGGSVTLTATPGATYLWSNGATSKEITVTDGGNYSVMVTNTNGCSATSANTTVVVYDLPTPSISSSGPINFCNGGSVTLTASNGSNYLWSNGATSQAISVTNSGNYWVRVTNTNGCSATSTSTSVVVSNLPTAGISASGPTSFCSGGSVTLTASAGSSYLWSNGATTQSISVSNSGNYSVSVTNNNGCSATSVSTSVVVYDLPATTISASGPLNFCSGGLVTLTATSGSSYLWSNGATTQSISVANSGNYSVSITNSNGCSATSATTSVVVNDLPTSSITASGATSFCSGGSTILTAAPGSSYLWSNGATTQAITVSNTGNYSVSVTNSNGCSATSAITSVVVNDLPSAIIAASGATSFCSGGSVTLTASAGSSYLWSNGATTQAVTVSNGGNYSVRVTNSNGCAANSVGTTVTVYDLPTPSISATGSTSFCIGGSVTLTASTGSSYLWSNGTTSQSITISNTGNYSVRVTNGNGCSATSAATAVVVNNLPSATISASGATNFCNGGSVTLTASANAGYLWSTGATSQSIVVSNGGNYSVTVTNNNGCSSTSAPISTSINPSPIDANITASASQICLGQSITISSSGGSGTPYYWASTNSGGSWDVFAGQYGGQSSFTYTPTQAGYYSFYVWNQNGCGFCWNTGTCTASSYVTVFVSAPPIVSIVGPSSICSGESATLNAAINGGFSSSTKSATEGFWYQWSTGATSPSINVSTAGIYTVTVTNPRFGCSSSATHKLMVTSVKPTISATGNLCSSGFVTLTSSSANNYLWSTGQTTKSIYVYSAGSYYVTTSLNGCTATSNTYTVASCGTPCPPQLVSTTNGRQSLRPCIQQPLLSTTLSVFPNKADREINVQISKSFHSDTPYAFYNQFGNLIETNILKGGNQDFIIETNDLPDGLYILKLDSEEGIITQKIIVSHRQ